MPNPSFRPKSTVTFRGDAWRVVKAASPTELLIEKPKTREKQIVSVADLKVGVPERPVQPVEALHEADLAEAKRRLEIIQPILDADKGRIEVAHRVARETGIGSSTLRRWVRAYRQGGLLSDLAPRRRRRDMPKKLPKRVEAIVGQVIEEVFLARQKISIRQAYRELQRRCKAARVTPPHENTFRRRIADLPESVKVRRREGSKAARDRFDAVEGKFPGADFPLAVVQMDHTLLDVVLVDDETRQPIGRPWLTLAVDLFSRMATGFYLSLDPPSSFSVGMCVAHSTLPKEPYLDRLRIEGEWPVWGLMRRLHLDNAKEFRGRTLMAACEEYGIGIDWRPVKKPHFGGHIERLMGTLAKDVHALPGTTFSNVSQKGEYDSARHAAMTYREMELWLTRYLVGVYHKRIHRGIGCSPEEMWRRGVMGHGRQKGTGLPEPVVNERRLRLDFLPSARRTVQREGIFWDKVAYFADSLRPWINARKGGKTQAFTVRRDPRDISRIYFFDPEIKEYLEIPYRDIARPSLSIWEFRDAERFLRAQGRPATNDDKIFAAHAELARIVDTAKTETRKARRRKQSKRLAAAAPTAAVPVPVAANLSLAVDNKSVGDGDRYDISDDDVDFSFEVL